MVIYAYTNNVNSVNSIYIYILQQYTSSNVYYIPYVIESIWLHNMYWENIKKRVLR